MKERSITPVPKLLRIMEELGENLKLARLRRRLTTDQVCERAGISRTTLWQIEKGAPNVSMGAYAQVLFVLGLEKDDIIDGHKPHRSALACGDPTHKGR